MTDAEALERIRETCARARLADPPPRETCTRPDGEPCPPKSEVCGCTRCPFREVSP